MKCYLIYSECTIWLTENFEDKDSGMSEKFENINEMIRSFRENYKNYNMEVYEECCNENKNTFFQLSDINNI